MNSKRQFPVGWMVVLLIVGGTIFVFRSELSRVTWRLLRPLTQEHSVRSRLKQFGPAVKERLASDFKRAGVQYPPKQIGLIALKEEKVLQLFACDESSGGFRFVLAYPIQAASGESGPKLKEGDHQVPEGIYRVESLNPNSMFHLALRVSYPNEFDRKMATAEGRTNLGGDIMIHGRAISVGCLAMGDPAIEELFVLAALTGRENVEIVIAPTDLRRRSKPSTDGMPPWTAELYERIAQALKTYPSP